MDDRILVLNAGSSSLKFCVYRDAAGAPALLLRGQVEGLADAPHLQVRDAEGRVLREERWEHALGHDRATALVLDLVAAHGDAGRLRAVGHRVVHGGTAHDAPVRVDDGVLADLERLVPLAPLHQPHNLAPIRALRARRPELTQVACFDTAFHRTQPAVAQAFALPARITDLGVHRYGFHGLSYEFIAQRLPALDPAAAGGRTVVLHLGAGASLCALLGGRSVASSMGFTALDGLPMGTRCGSLDPGVILYLMRALGMDADTVEHLLYHESGLLGVSGLSADLRVLEAAEDPRAAAAIALFTYRIGREIGSAAAALGGLDALVFTAGIGEHSRGVRAAVCQGARWLGLDFDAGANATHGPRISTPGSAVRAWVIPTDEEAMIARHAATLA